MEDNTRKRLLRWLRNSLSGIKSSRKKINVFLISSDWSCDGASSMPLRLVWNNCLLNWYSSRDNIQPFCDASAGNLCQRRKNRNYDGSLLDIIRTSSAFLHKISLRWFSLPRHDFHNREFMLILSISSLSERFESALCSSIAIHKIRFRSMKIPTTENWKFI